MAVSRAAQSWFSARCGARLSATVRSPWLAATTAAMVGCQLARCLSMLGVGESGGALEDLGPMPCRHWGC
jgi:hypothetical protein